MVTLSDANSYNACGITNNVCRGCSGAADHGVVQWENRLDEKETIERKCDAARVRVDLASLVLSLHAPKVKSARTPTLRCHRSIRIVLSDHHTPLDGSVINCLFLTSSFG